MMPLNNSAAIRRIIEDKLRMLVADHGAKLIAAPRLVSRSLRLDVSHLKWLMLEHRLTAGQRLTPAIKRELPSILENLDSLISRDAKPLALDSSSGARALVLRAPHWDEKFTKGVLLIKFTETFASFYRYIDIARLMQFFRIVLEPSWSGYCLPEILLWARYQEPVIVQASEVSDREFLSQLRTNLVPIEIGASDWVDHRVFRPITVEKKFDAVYVANLTPMKRVNVFVRAISRIVRESPRFSAAIVLSSWGGNQHAFEQMLRFYRVRENITVLMNQTQHEINRILNESRVSVLLSRKEGSNKTLFESMFANTPVILLRNNVGVNKSYINAHTGLLVEEGELPAAMLSFVDGKGSDFQPRDWAIANISPERSTEKLQLKLRELNDDGTLPLHAKVNTPEATYMDDAVASTMPPIGSLLGLFAKDRVRNLSQAETERALQQLYAHATRRQAQRSLM